MALCPKRSESEQAMNRTRIIVKNLVIAATLGMAGFASWALTEARTPIIEAAAQQLPQG
jgi:hypothetical protein